MRGPNYWSVRRHKLIVMVLDLEEMEEKPSNKVDGFAGRLKAMFPTMYSHRCSEGCEGGFFMRVDEGTWMGHIIEHIALEIQTLADMDTGFGRTRGYGEEGVYSVVFSYLEEILGDVILQLLQLTLTLTTLSTALSTALTLRGPTASEPATPPLRRAW